jgi:hypothetical protein
VCTYSLAHCLVCSLCAVVNSTAIDRLKEYAKTNRDLFEDTEYCSPGGCCWGMPRAAPAQPQLAPASCVASGSRGPAPPILCCLRIEPLQNSDLAGGCCDGIDHWPMPPLGCLCVNHKTDEMIHVVSLRCLLPSAGLLTLHWFNKTNPSHLRWEIRRLILRLMAVRRVMLYPGGVLHCTALCAATRYHASMRCGTLSLVPPVVRAPVSSASLSVCRPCVPLCVRLWCDCVQEQGGLLDPSTGAWQEGSKMAEELQHELLQLDQKANKVGACSPCSPCHAAWQVWFGGDRCTAIRADICQHQQMPCTLRCLTCHLPDLLPACLPPVTQLLCSTCGPSSGSRLPWHRRSSEG